MMTKHNRTGFRPRVSSMQFCALACLLLSSGCQSITGFSWVKPGSQSPAELRGEDDLDQLANIDDVQGPLEAQQRRRGFRRARENEIAGTSLKAAAGREELAELEELFEQKKYPAAERLAKSIVKKHPDSPVREDALFLQAEAQFHQKAYPWAADTYIALEKEFTSSRYQSASARRKFAICRMWLENTEYITSDNVELAGYNENGQSTITVKQEKKKSSSMDPSRMIPIYPNLWDRTRPVFDTEGRALEVLKSIWQNDPTGPLADDALMMTAGHYVRKRDYIEADHIYRILREEYPKSPHAKNAFVLGSFVKRASYQGPSYDGQSLEEAGKLTDSTLRMFPNHPDRDRIRDDQRKIAEQKAAQEWENVTFYQRKGRPKSVVVCAREVIRLYPSSTYADRARQLLRELQAASAPAPAPKSAPDSPDGPGAPRRLFSLPKLAMPTLPGFGRSQPEGAEPRILESSSNSEKSPTGRVRL